MKYFQKLLIILNFFFGKSFWLNFLSKKFNFYPLYLKLEQNYENKIFKQTQFSNSSSNKDYILFCPIFGFADAALSFDVLLTRTITNKNFPVKFLSCESSLKVCMYDECSFISGNKNFFDKYKRKIKCMDCSTRVKRISEFCNAEIIKLPILKNNNELDVKSELKNYSSMDYHANNSALRKCLVGSIDFSDETLSINNRFKLECKDYLRKLEILFTKLPLPKAAVMIHGIYLEHGVLLDFFKSKNIPVYVYGFAYRKGTVTIVSGDSYHVSPHNFKEEIWNKEVSIKDSEKLDNYLRSKVSGGRDNINFHPSPITNFQDIKSSLGENFDSNKTTFLLCTNVIWDAALYYSSEAYPNLLDAIDNVIDLAHKNKNIQIIIRIHPAESRGAFSTAQPILNEIEKKYDHLSDNIFIVNSESNLSTYALGDMCSFILNYASNVGLEFACAGKRVINLGKPYAHNKGFTIDIRSRNQLKEYLFNPTRIPVMTKNEITLAKRFAFFWFFRFMTDIQSLEYDVETVSKINFKNLDSDCPNIDLIAKSIISGEHIPYGEFSNYVS